MFPKSIYEIDNGATVNEFAAALHALNTSVREVGKGGEVTLTISVTPASKGNTDVVMVKSKVKAKLPEASRRQTVFYLDDNNQLVRNDPQQQTLPLRVVDIEQPKELKEVI
jgi:translation elongation factor P/translation initiation factor 5A